MGFRPPTVEGCDPDPYFLWPGVEGQAYPAGPYVVLWIIKATEIGSGRVGRFLDRLDNTVIIRDVGSPRLRGMLERRKWVSAIVGGSDYWFHGGSDPILAAKLLK